MSDLLFGCPDCARETMTLDGCCNPECIAAAPSDAVDVAGPPFDVCDSCLRPMAAQATRSTCRSCRRRQRMDP